MNRIKTRAIHEYKRTLAAIERYRAELYYFYKTGIFSVAGNYISPLEIYRCVIGKRFFGGNKYGTRVLAETKEIGQLWGLMLREDSNGGILFDVLIYCSTSQES